jgi:hypothetical protein
MTHELPRVEVPAAPSPRFRLAGDFAGLPAEAWAGVPALRPLERADGGGPALHQTMVRACCDGTALYVRFDCDDPDIWATFTQRDDPIYDEEVVEVFITPGAGDPIDYYEFEISPAGVLFDGRVHNPTSTRANLVVDEKWDCPGIRWASERDDPAHRWSVALAIPWAGITPDGRPPKVCRANFYRIERPRAGAPEFSCWSPTLTDPADFHKPARFGFLHLPF